MSCYLAGVPIEDLYAKYRLTLTRYVACRVTDQHVVDDVVVDVFLRASAYADQYTGDAAGVGAWLTGHAACAVGDYLWSTRSRSPRPVPGALFEPLEGSASQARDGRVLVTAVTGDQVTARNARGATEQLSADLLTATHWIVAFTQTSWQMPEEHIGTGQSATCPVPPTAEDGQPASNDELAVRRADVLHLRPALRSAS